MKKRILGLAMAAWCISSLVIASSPIRTFAASEDNSGGVVLLDSNKNLKVPEDSIIDAQIMPGQTVKQVFQISNKSNQAVSVYISSNMKVTDAEGNPIRNEEGKSFKEDLVRKLQLKITDATGKLIYSGPCSGDSDDAKLDFFKAAYPTATITEGFFRTETNTKGIGLGGIAAGSSLTLTAEVTMDGASFGNDYQNVYSLFNWNFYCEGDDPIIIPPSPTPGGDDPITPDDPTNPTDPTDPGDGTDIPDPDTPTDDGDPDNGNTNIDDDGTPTTDITITDDDVPEGDTLAHTGFKVVYLKEAGIILAVLVVALVAVSKVEKRKKMKKN